MSDADAPADHRTAVVPPATPRLPPDWQPLPLRARRLFVLGNVSGLVLLALGLLVPIGLLLRGTLGDIAAKVRASGTLRTAVILVGRVLDPGGFADSRLYAADHRRAFKPGDES